ncbi:MAG: OB-fold domain-containing protein [Candidatus Tectomicrobia bacterium]|uniref:OB-fold domain-containing protein n=1 Tax=Tectimicrobiota bacterium TaxID=2528274 RepID=A0A932CSW6_UNCTE|nr:OB-fold domain-containing protein [Candidatus Tectomicrobia bacterium]
MVGITSYGAYIPLYRLARSEIAKTWGVAAQGGGERSVANFDEDSLTMAVAASLDCLQGADRRKVEGFFLATTTAPYVEKQIATTGAIALDLNRTIRTADFTNSLRAGTGALLSAIDAVKAGSRKNVLVAAADSRQAQTQGGLEQTLGDGAAALLIGDTDVAATLEASYSLSDEFTDVWRAYGDSFLRGWEERFTIDEGYNRLLPEAVSGLLKQCNLSPQQINKAVFYGSNERRHKGMIKLLGFKPEQVQDGLFSAVGDTGAALPLMMLVGALETAKAGDKILVASYGNGCDALLLSVTDRINQLRNRRGIKGYLAAKKPLPSYQKYLTWRGLVPVAPPARPDREPTSMTAVWRERAQNLGLYSSKCTSCGAQQYPIQRVCVKCHAKDTYELVRLVDQSVKIFTFTQDNLAASVDPPAVVAVVEFEGGGRGYFDMTDRDPQEVKVGMLLEFTFRKLYSDRGVHNYYWKVMPPRVSS